MPDNDRLHNYFTFRGIPHEIIRVEGLRHYDSVESAKADRGNQGKYFTVIYLFDFGGISVPYPGMPLKMDTQLIAKWTTETGWIDKQHPKWSTV